MLFFVCAAAGGGGAAPEDELLSGNLEKARSLIRDRKYREALPFLNAALEEGAFARARYLRGDVYLKLDQSGAALQESETLIKQQPENWRGYALKARVLRTRGIDRVRAGKLVRVLDRLLDRLPEDQREWRHRAYLMRGRALVERNQFEAAVNDFRRVKERVKRRPGSARPAARAAFIAGDHPLADEMAAAVLNVVPADLTAGRIRSFIRDDVPASVEKTVGALERAARQGNHSRALEGLRTLMQTHPARPFLYLLRGSYLLEMNRLAPAASFCREAERRDAGVASAFLLGSVREKQKRYERAVSWYRRARHRAGRFPDAGLRIGVCRSRAGDHDRAVTAFAEVPERVSYDREAGRWFVRSCLRAGYLVYAQERLPDLLFSRAQRKWFKDRIQRRLRRRRDREEEAFEDGVYRNRLYGLQIRVPVEWSYSANPGRARVVALFVVVKKSDRFFITAQRRPPHLKDPSFTSGDGARRIREYLIRSRLRSDSTLRFEYQEPWVQPKKTGLHLLFKGDEQSRLHLFVAFHRDWMLTFYYLTDHPTGAQFDRMKQLMKRIKMMERD